MAGGFPGRPGTSEVEGLLISLFPHSALGRWEKRLCLPQVWEMQRKKTCLSVSLLLEAHLKKPQTSMFYLN